MKQLITDTDDLAAVEPAILEKHSGKPGATRWLQRFRSARAGALLGSFPSRVFLLALAFYITLTCLHIWFYGTASAVPGSWPLADWGAAFTSAWRRFDSYFFLHVAQRGYTNQGLGAFFPLYPLLARLFAWPLAGHFTLAALLVSWLCAWGSFLWFYRLAARECGTRVARFALLLLALCPVSFFAFAPYSESLFLLVSIGAVERARAGRLWQAGALAALGMLTRPTGILLLLPLAWEWARRSPTILRLSTRLKERVTRQASSEVSLAVAENPLPRLAWLALGLVPLALLGYMLFLKLHNGNALAFLAGESAWHRHVTLPWDTVGLFGLAFQQTWQAGDYTALIGNLLDLLLVIPLPAWVLYCAIRRKQLWLGAALYQLALTLMLIAVPTMPGPTTGEEVLLSTQRFMLPAFPLFLLVGQLETRHPWLYRVLLVVSSVFLLLNTWNFLNNVFIA